MPRPGWSKAAPRGGRRRVIGRRVRDAELTSEEAADILEKIMAFHADRRELVRRARNGDRVARLIVLVRWKCRLLVTEERRESGGPGSAAR